MLGTLIILGYLFGGVALTVGVVGGMGALIYKFFLADWLKYQKMERNRIDITPESIEKLAKLKLISENTIEVETFVTNNASILSDDMVNQLVAHIEELKLKQKFTDLEVSLEETAEKPVHVKSE